jgi:hypothetical protein
MNTRIKRNLFAALSALFFSAHGAVAQNPAATPELSIASINLQPEDKGFYTAYVYINAKNLKSAANGLQFNLIFHHIKSLEEVTPKLHDATIDLADQIKAAADRPDSPLH